MRDFDRARPGMCRRYVRVKRKNSTVFLHVEPSDHFASLKSKCGDIMGVPASSVQLIHTDRVRIRLHAIQPQC